MAVGPRLREGGSPFGSYSAAFARGNFMKSGKRNPLLHLVRARPRLFIATLVAVAFGLLLPTQVSSHVVTRWLLAWNVGAGLYVVLAAVMMMRSANHHMRHRAQLQDDGQLVILVLVVVATIASLAAIAGELVVVKDMHGLIKSAHIALTGVTVLTSWAFIQVMFARFCRNSAMKPSIGARPMPIRKPASRTGSPQTRLGL